MGLLTPADITQIADAVEERIGGAVLRRLVLWSSPGLREWRLGYQDRFYRCELMDSGGIQHQWVGHGGTIVEAVLNAFSLYDRNVKRT